ncbi:uncharacterized protein LOC124258506 [Haliotis rubra]|uniref:uncharacterized protein LOC124258506 n=1 Tax=Haliotis rubra TaxID=36100 RepID=UPI001EE5B8AA|nr:uncharacterized protein LOC124258506 [Haliotis rubra]
MAARKVLQVLLWCYFVCQLGGFVSIIGPTLPDLQDHFQASLTEISYLFLSLGFAMSAGCLLSMAVLKFLDPNLALAVFLLVAAAVTPLVALTPLLYVGCVAVVVVGVVLACAFNCVCHQCNVLFPGNPSIIHGVFIASSVGGITSPLIASPFLRQRINNSSNESAPPVEDNLTTEPSQNVLSIIPLLPLSQNSTAGWNFMSTRLTSSLLLKNDTNFTTSSTDILKSDATQVHLVYIIVGIAFLPAAVGFMVLYILQEKCRVPNPPQEVSTAYVSLDERGEKGKCIFVIFLSLLAVTYIPFAGIPYSYSSFLTTYGIESALRLDVQKMAEITSFLWLMYLLGRILSTVVSLYLTQSTIMFVCLIGTLLSAILVTIIGPLSETCLWVGSLPLGLFTAPLLAASLGWCRTCVTLTPIVLGVCTLGDMAGAALLPYVTGQIIGRFGLDWYMYSIIIYAAFQLVSFGVLSILGQMLKTV